MFFIKQGTSILDCVPYLNYWIFWGMLYAIYLWPILVFNFFIRNVVEEAENHAIENSSLENNYNSSNLQRQILEIRVGWFTWFIGGLNHQIEHHLFICHGITLP